jgi:hypothetical protein
MLVMAKNLESHPLSSAIFKFAFNGGRNKTKKKEKQTQTETS